ncbi:unnamed protein product [Calicophoron daubneyi]|uniref:Enoyl-CoA hydratase n=1 Tax=Calicophoron daubneyi TaxID=300641 RepID=A0AAV2TG89_CALDB
MFRRARAGMLALDSVRSIYRGREFLPDLFGLARIRTLSSKRSLMENLSKERESVIVDRTSHDGIAVMALNYNMRKNALSKSFTADMAKAVSELEKDKKSRVLIICSLIPGVFCAGADLKERAQVPDDDVPSLVGGLRALFQRIHLLPMPTIAAIDGAALGGGLELALACDIRFAGVLPHCQIGLIETHWALLPGAGGTQRLSRLIGEAKAKELMFAARRLTALEAAKLGVVNEAVKSYLLPDEWKDSPALYRSFRYADELTTKGPIALRLLKRAVNEGLCASSLKEGLDIEGECYKELVHTKDRHEELPYSSSAVSGLSYSAKHRRLIFLLVDALAHDFVRRESDTYPVESLYEMKSYGKDALGIRWLSSRRSPIEHLSTKKETVVLDRTSYNGIAVMALNHQARKNALSKGFVENIEKAVNELENDKSSRVTIICSLVPGVFCAGGDLKERAQVPDDDVPSLVGGLRALFQRIHLLPMPTIAAIDGAALGGGLELALACDIRFAGVLPRCQIGLIASHWAVLPGLGGTQRLSRLIGEAKAKELMFAARRLTALEAAKLGVVNEAVKSYLLPDEWNESPALYRSFRYADELTTKGPIALRLLKRAVNEGLCASSLQEGLDIEGECYKELVHTKDRHEGMCAFMERRKPIYHGH